MKKVTIFIGFTDSFAVINGEEEKVIELVMGINVMKTSNSLLNTEIIKSGSRRRWWLK